MTISPTILAPPATRKHTPLGVHQQLPINLPLYHQTHNGAKLKIRAGNQDRKKLGFTAQEGQEIDWGSRIHMVSIDFI